jgi:integrase
VYTSVPTPDPLQRASGDRSLAELLALIRADTTLREPRRGAMASAVNTVARALGLPLDAIPAAPVRLRPLLAGVTPAMAKVSTGSWRNALSLLGGAIDHVEGGILPRRFDSDPSPAWADLLRGLRKRGHALYYLGRLARYATLLGVEPEGVDDRLLDRYLDDLTNRSLVAEPSRVARETARAWNHAGETHAAWPQQPLTVPDNTVRHSLPWDRYPASLTDEVEEWIDWLGRDLLADRDFRALRPESLEARRKLLALYLGALVAAGEDPATMTSFAEVITPAKARRALEFIYERRGKQKCSHVAQIARVPLLIAKHWLKLDHDVIDKLRRMANNLRPDHVGLAPRNEQRLAQLDDPARLQAVLTLPDRIAAKVIRGGEPTVASARLMETALAIEIFQMTGLRIKNLAGLEIGRTLLLQSHGGVKIVIPAGEVKNRVPIVAELPAPSVRLLRRHIDTYRPLLGDPKSAWLFPGARPGARKTTDALRSQVSKAMAQLAGVHWHPHLFRHFVAYLEFLEDPGADGVVMRTLGHKRADTTRMHYIGFQTAGAIRHHDELVLRRRAAYGRLPRGVR